VPIIEAYKTQIASKITFVFGEYVDERLVEYLLKNGIIVERLPYPR